MTVQEVSEQLKIPVIYINALEKEDFHIFPSHAHLRAFIRGYSKLMELDYREMLNMYEATGKEMEESSLVDYKGGRSRRLSPEAARRLKKYVFYAAAALVAIMLIGLIRSCAGSKSTDIQTQSAEAGGSKSKTAPVLEISAREEVYLRVTRPDEAPEDLIMKQGDRRTWQIEDSITLRIGNAFGVDVTLNGKPVDLQNKDRKKVLDRVIYRNGGVDVIKTVIPEAKTDGK